jgi:Kdo2-lipid IVA lauroyltransferase/acyltransferase
VERIARAVPDNVGRTVIEIYSGPEFIARAVDQPLTGGGVAALEEAHRQKRPVILVTGHFGNYDASRAALIGGATGSARFTCRWPTASSTNTTSRQSRASARRSFHAGGPGWPAWCATCALAGCWECWSISTWATGEELTFFGRPALTALSAAELALKYDALLVPTYAVRRSDGLSFDIIVEPPIPHGTPDAMTQALNDSLEALVRQHLDQWFWIHRRWKKSSRR